VNTILPLVSGMRVVQTPDPNDASTLANLIQHTKATLLTSTPTFLKGVCAIAHNDQISSLRLSVVGAEKAPEELFHLFSTKAPNAILLEGYGITECSPIIAVNPYHKGSLTKRGTVGLPVKGASIKVLDLTTGEEAKTGEEGMIYVAGPFVFNGYLDPTLESPFQQIEKTNYYKTGDLGFVDEDGFLHISGRLKRFVKIAGEMISLPAVEEIVLGKYGSEKEVVLAIEAKEYGDGSVKFVAFSTKALEVSKLNAYLRERGVSNLVKITEVVLLDEIPLLGTGKTDFMSLRKMIV
jgi:long-chain-fatty-acid--[acyl-carrier-protein] ligase